MVGDLGRWEMGVLGMCFAMGVRALTNGGLGSERQEAGRPSQVLVGTAHWMAVPWLGEGAAQGPPTWPGGSLVSPWL